MSFQYARLSAADLAPLVPRIQGPVLASVGSAAVDADSGAVLLDLGGKPTMDPARGEPPGHYNLMWGNDVFQASGHHKISKEGDGFVTDVSLSLGAPGSAAGKIEEVQRLLSEAMAALLNGRLGANTTVRVVFSRIDYT